MFFFSGHKYHILLFHCIKKIRVLNVHQIQWNLDNMSHESRITITLYPNKNYFHSNVTYLSIYSINTCFFSIFIHSLYNQILMAASIWCVGILSNEQWKCKKSGDEFQRIKSVAPSIYVIIIKQILVKLLKPPFLPIINKCTFEQIPILFVFKWDLFAATF